MKPTQEIVLSIPVIWILVQNLVIILLAFFVLRIVGLYKKPTSGLEFSQVLVGGLIILAMVCIANAGNTTYFDTFLGSSGSLSERLDKTVFHYFKYLLIILLFEFLFVGIYFSIQRLTVGIKPQPGSSIQEGNLPLAMLLSGVIGGLGFSLSKLLALILEQVSPSIVVFN